MNLLSVPPLGPGDTETLGDVGAAAPLPFTKMPELKGLCERKVVLLATATITEENLYSNGLFQNVFMLYRMFDAMGYASILLVSDKPKVLEKIPSLLRGCRTVSTEDLLRQPIQGLYAILEIGMSIDACLRNFLKILGARIFKLYLGNILNIDTELPTFLPGHFFLHHSVGEVQEILVSPHYGQHAEYASYLNDVKPPSDHVEDMIAPYIWDTSILTRDGTQKFEWTAAAADPTKQVFVVMEPNISFQKAALVPLLALERWYRTVGKARGWEGTIVLVNGDRIDAMPHFRENVRKTLDLDKDGRITVTGRKSIVEVMREWPSAAFVLHNYNNEFNYMTLELLSSGFPVLHNAPSWAAYGYSYKGADLAGAATQIERIRTEHKDNREVYRGHAAALAWRYSPYNPLIHEKWERILRGDLRKRAGTT